jgi:hypothetical protein
LGRLPGPVGCFTTCFGTLPGAAQSFPSQPDLKMLFRFTQQHVFASRVHGPSFCQPIVFCGKATTIPRQDTTLTPAIIEHGANTSECAEFRRPSDTGTAPTVCFEFPLFVVGALSGLPRFFDFPFIRDHHPRIIRHCRFCETCIPHVSEETPRIQKSPRIPLSPTSFAQ